MSDAGDELFECDDCGALYPEDSDEWYGVSEEDSTGICADCGP